MTSYRFRQYGFTGLQYDRVFNKTALVGMVSECGLRTRYDDILFGHASAQWHMRLWGDGAANYKRTKRRRDTSGKTKPYITFCISSYVHSYSFYRLLCFISFSLFRPSFLFIYNSISACCCGRRTGPSSRWKFDETVLICIAVYIVRFQAQTGLRTRRYTILRDCTYFTRVKAIYYFIVERRRPEQIRRRKKKKRFDRFSCKTYGKPFCRDSIKKKKKAQLFSVSRAIILF